MRNSSTERVCLVFLGQYLSFYLRRLGGGQNVSTIFLHVPNIKQGQCVSMQQLKWQGHKKWLDGCCMILKLCEFLLAQRMCLCVQV